MEDEPLPVDVSLEVQDSDNVAAVFIGYETPDGTEIIIASAKPPASARLRGSRLQQDEE